jgi:hypothetical protein
LWHQDLNGIWNFASMLGPAGGFPEMKFDSLVF